MLTDPLNGLAVWGLLVDRTLCGDQQVGEPQLLVQADQFGDQVQAGAQPRVQEELQCPAEPACGARAGQLGNSGGVLATATHQAGQDCVQLADIVGAGALLRSVDSGSPARPQERIGDIAGDLHANPAQPRVETGGVHPRQLAQAGGCRREFGALRVEETHAKDGQHAGPRLVGGAAPDADHQPFGPGVQCGQHQLPEPAGVELEDPAFGGRHPL